MDEVIDAAWTAYRDAQWGALGSPERRKAASRRVRRGSFEAGYRAASAESTDAYEAALAQEVRRAEAAERRIVELELDLSIARVQREDLREVVQEAARDCTCPVRDRVLRKVDDRG